MKKTLTPLLIAAAVALSACGQDLSGGDWRTTWQGEDGGMLALRADEALYTYRTWYGRTGQGDLWDIGNRQVLLRYGDGSYLLARSGSGFTLRSLEGSMGELDGVSYVPADSSSS